MGGGDRLPDLAPDVDLDELRGALLREPEWGVPEGLVMTVVYIQEFAYKDWSTANYDWAKEQIGDDRSTG